jgi:AcrR family transcriptional regulator
MTPIEPQRWSDEQMEVDRQVSITRFREERLREPLEQYLETFDTYRGVVEDLLEATVDLTKLSPPEMDVLTDPALLEAVRYLAGPPISKDDLEVLADGSLSPKQLRADPDMALRVVETILVALDRRRFPWVAEGREPSEAEREGAALASAALLATQRLSTSRRSESKDAQEQSVADALVRAGFQEVSTRTIKTLDNAPREGEFCRESLFGTRKADFVVGLWDGRKMPVECKVSNSSTNSVKRLNNDAAVKATRWLEEFGTVQTVPVAVIGGVFKAHNLKAAQGSGLTLFWAHNLDAMLDWIELTR